jgi:hypothetical protein
MLMKQAPCFPVKKWKADKATAVARRCRKATDLSGGDRRVTPSTYLEISNYDINKQRNLSGSNRSLVIWIVTLSA